MADKTFYGLVRGPESIVEDGKTEVWRPTYDPQDCTRPDAEFAFGTTVEEAVEVLKARHPLPDLGRCQLRQVVNEKGRDVVVVVTRYPEALGLYHRHAWVPGMVAYLAADPERRVRYNGDYQVVYDSEEFQQSDLYYDRDTHLFRLDPERAEARRRRIKSQPAREARKREKYNEARRKEREAAERRRAVEKLQGEFWDHARRWLHSVPPFDVTELRPGGWHQVADYLDLIRAVCRLGKDRDAYLDDASLVQTCRDYVSQFHDLSSPLRLVELASEGLTKDLRERFEKLEADASSLVRRAERRGKRNKKAEPQQGVTDDRDTDGTPVLCDHGGVHHDARP